MEHSDLRSLMKGNNKHPCWPENYRLSMCVAFSLRTSTARNAQLKSWAKHTISGVSRAETLQEQRDNEGVKEAGSRLFAFLQGVAHTWRGHTMLVVSHGAILRGMLMMLGCANATELPPGSVPLRQLESIHVDEQTQQAIEDWHYWVNQGYQLSATPDQAQI